MRKQLATSVKFVSLSHLTPMGLSCQISHCVACRAHSWIRMLFSSAPSPQQSKTHSSTTKARSQEDSFLISTNLLSPCPVTNTCGIFSSKSLPSSSAGQPRAMVTGDSLHHFLTNNSGGSMPYMTPGFLFGKLWLLVGVICMCICMCV